MLSDFEIGLYAVAWRILAPADTLVATLCTFLLPRLTDPHARPSAIADWADTSKAFCLLLALGAAVLLVAADALIHLTVGPAYADAASIIRVLALGIVLDGVLTAFSGLLRAPGHHRILIALEGCGLLVNTPLLLVFVTMLGFLGAAVAGVMAQAAAVGFLAAVLHRRHRDALARWLHWTRRDIGRAAGYIADVAVPAGRRRQGLGAWPVGDV